MSKHFAVILPRSIKTYSVLWSFVLFLNDLICSGNHTVSDVSLHIHVSWSCLELEPDSMGMWIWTWTWMWICLVLVWYSGRCFSYVSFPGQPLSLSLCKCASNNTWYGMIGHASSVVADTVLFLETFEIGWSVNAQSGLVSRPLDVSGSTESTNTVVLWGADMMK